ncbi:signal recognition particle-docking protein FtsY [Thiomicrorhabdus sp. Kp2]|uniref:signal recognition particle-docking protein FtsY n=1 Tax=Thiomicrorhabdus sp. Kp2 TaxID=1123518 RepID=UPI000424897F|nr:signal recognition particle-docking protein FtsY [Thiomicrorhabdus sp. Kp2]
MFSFLRRNKKNEEASDINAEEASQNLDKLQQEEQPVKETEQPQESTEQSSTASQAETARTETAPIAEQAADFEEMTVEKPVDETKAKPTTEESTDIDIAKEPEQKKMGFFTRLKNGLSKTRQSFTESLAGLVLGRKEIDEDLLDDLEMILLTADVGIDATDRIIKNLTEQVSRKELKDPEALINALKIQLQEIIDPMSQPLDIDTHLAKQSGPFVILMVGINGVGKTTTIGKLAKKYQLEGKSVMLAAGDTFRAAAVEQLQTWGERNNVPVMAQKTGADSAAVIFDAIQSAKAKNIDVLIADTAGRLHTQSNLMEELKKVKRVIAKVDETAPHEVMLVIDAGTGQNALNQAQQFQEAVDVSGITLTKLDGTAKGGIVFALAEQRQIPIRFIGVGESIDDLRAFDSKSFTEALFDQSQSN